MPLRKRKKAFVPPEWLEPTSDSEWVVSAVPSILDTREENQIQPPSKIKKIGDIYERVVDMSEDESSEEEQDHEKHLNVHEDDVPNNYNFLETDIEMVDLEDEHDSISNHSNKETQSDISDNQIEQGQSDLDLSDVGHIDDNISNNQSEQGQSDLDLSDVGNIDDNISNNQSDQGQSDLDVDDVDQEYLNDEEEEDNPEVPYVDYSECLNELSRQWINCEIHHAVSKTASNELWRVAKNHFKKLYELKSSQNVQSKVPQLAHIRRKMVEEKVPPISMEVAYQDKETDEVIVLEDLTKSPVSQYPPHKYLNLYERATVKVNNIYMLLRYISRCTFTYMCVSLNSDFLKQSRPSID